MTGGELFTTGYLIVAVLAVYPAAMAAERKVLEMGPPDPLLDRGISVFIGIVVAAAWLPLLVLVAAFCLSRAFWRRVLGDPSGRPNESSTHAHRP